MTLETALLGHCSHPHFVHEEPVTYSRVQSGVVHQARGGTGWEGTTSACSDVGDGERRVGMGWTVGGGRAGSVTGHTEMGCGSLVGGVGPGVLVWKETWRGESQKEGQGSPELR